MRAAVQLAGIIAAVLAAGCATSVEVWYDETRDFSRYRTWDWLPGARSVEAATGEEEALAALTARAVAEALRRRGLARVPGSPDLLVGYALRVERRYVAVSETGAHQLLASHHASPSYLVQSTETRVEIYDHGHLQVVVTDGRRERRLWRGELRANRRGRFARHLTRAVAQLFERFPAPPLESAAR